MIYQVQSIKAGLGATKEQLLEISNLLKGLSDYLNENYALMPVTVEFINVPFVESAELQTIKVL